MSDHGHQEDGTQTSRFESGEEQRDDRRSGVLALPPQTRLSDSQSAPLDEPFFPSVDEAVDTNQRAIGTYHQIFGDSPEWGGVLKPNELESAIGSAKNHYHYDEEPDDAARYAQAVAKMGWRIAGSQVFANGNKRSAYGLMQHALDQNGLGHLSPVDQEDPELVDHLVAQDSYGGEGIAPEHLPAQRQRLEDEYLNMWKQRYAQGGPTPNYQQRYPEGTYISNPEKAQTQNLQGLAHWGIFSAVQDRDSWFEDYSRQVIASEPAALPPNSLRIGAVTAGWFETAPGVAHIYAGGGNVADRFFAQIYLREALAGHGIRRAEYRLDWDHSDKQMIKEADWSDIEAKAKRLIQSGKVRILRNSPEMVVGHVEGDHGDYQTEISRNDPNSQAIALWDCECDWDQFAWQRTRQWKKYEGRVCSHVLATYWLAQSMPMDEELNPAEGQPGPPGGEQGQAPPPGESPMGSGMVPPAGAPQPQQPGMQNQVAPVPPPPQAPPGQAPELIPQFPPATMPAVNPVSIPGGKEQTPLNPIQNIGVPGVGGTFSHVGAQQFVNGDIVSNNFEDVGKTSGLGEEVPKTIPANSVGEVLGSDETTGMVNVYFAGPQAGAGNMEPHGVTGWFMPGEIRARPDVRAPGPAVRRRT